MTETKLSMEQIKEKLAGYNKEFYGEGWLIGYLNALVDFGFVALEEYVALCDWIDNL
jgi:hypothetical protein